MFEGPRMRISCSTIALALLPLLAPPLLAQEHGLQPSLRSHLEFYHLDQPKHSFTFDEGIKAALISLKQHSILPNESYSTIIEQYGVRSDPISIYVYRQLNQHRFSVRNLPPGATIFVIDNHRPQPLMLSMHTDITTSIAQQESLFRRNRGQLRAWVQQSPNNEPVAQIQSIYEQIIASIQHIRVTGYALDRSLLESTNEALNVVNEIVEDLVRSGRIPTEKESQFLQGVAEDIGRQDQAARDIDGNLIEAHVETISVMPKIEMAKEEIFGLRVCFRHALKLLLFKWYKPNEEPNWLCTEGFDTLSSPAMRLFRRHLKYAIWAVNRDLRVSEHEIVTILPNQPDGTYRYELSVNKS